MAKKEKRTIDVAQEEEIRKTQEIIINETMLNQAIKESEHQDNVKKVLKNLCLAFYLFF